MQAHTRAHGHVQTDTYTDIHPHLSNTYTHGSTDIHTYTQIGACTQRDMKTHMYTHAHPCLPHAHTHTHTEADRHYSLLNMLAPVTHHEFKQFKSSSISSGKHSLT